MGWLKLFADGRSASQTAALLEPERARDRGACSPRSQDELAELVPRAAAGGNARPKIHSIGDAAVRKSLDLLARRPRRSSSCPAPGARPALLLARPVAVRGARRGRVRPARASARGCGDGATRLGARAEANGYTWRTLVEAGAVVAFGTDAPVEPVDPWPGIAMAVLRRDPSWGAGAEPLGPDETLTLEQALRAATVGPPCHAKDPLGGRLDPGSGADLIVLPAAPRGAASAPPRSRVRPRLVLLDGEVVIERSQPRSLRGITALPVVLGGCTVAQCGIQTGRTEGSRASSRGLADPCRAGTGAERLSTRGGPVHDLVPRIPAPADASARVAEAVRGQPRPGLRHGFWCWARNKRHRPRRAISGTGSRAQRSIEIVPEVVDVLQADVRRISVSGVPTAASEG